LGGTDKKKPFRRGKERRSIRFALRVAAQAQGWLPAGWLAFTGRVSNPLDHYERFPTAIVNVSSGLAFIPLPISPIYSATKSAIHAFTLSLRLQLKNTGVKVFELAPPGTDTPLFHGDFRPEDTGGLKPMSVETLVQCAIAGLEKDVLEIRPGLANFLKIASRAAPDFMLKRLGRSVDIMHVQAKG
jgi:short-subunit dehydrogenase involved in D-alanine esterification of teichoic acids